MPSSVHWPIRNVLRNHVLDDFDVRTLIDSATASNAGPLAPSVAELGDLFQRTSATNVPFRTETPARDRLHAFLVAHHWQPTATPATWDQPLGTVGQVPEKSRHSASFGMTLDAASVTRPEQLHVSDSAVIAAFGNRPFPATSGALYSVASSGLRSFLEQVARDAPLRTMAPALQVAWLNVYARAAELERDGVHAIAASLTSPQWGSWGSSRATQLRELFSSPMWSELKATPEVASALQRVIRALGEPAADVRFGGRKLSEW